MATPRSSDWDKRRGLLMNTKNNPENEKLPVNDEQTTKELQDATKEIPSPVDNSLPLDVPNEEPVPEPGVAVAAEENETGSVPDDVVPEEEPVSEVASVNPVVDDKVAQKEKDVDTEEPVSIDYELEDAREEEEADEEETDDEEEHDPEADASLDESSVSLLPIEEIVQHLRNLLQSDNPKRKDVDEYKNQFYRSLRNETEGQKQAFLANGGEEIDFISNEPALFTEGKELLQKIKEKRSVIAAREEAEKEKNVARKLAIIEQIKLLTETQGQEDFNKSYQEFKSLQQEWNEIKQVPQAKVNELWKSYQRYVEKFYDLVRINNEFREYDFKKNLELKTDLCEAAERLDEETDVISAFHQLQNLHQEWREIGPVSRKDREEIWNRFKEASTNINKKYQAHFEELRGKEDENLELKTALCEKLEAIDYSRLTTVREWNNKVKEVLDIQSQWRQIGYVPRKWNTKIYKRYRAACDLFFKTKNDFYKSLRGEMEENLRKKIELCERAEAMKESHDWKKTTQEMIDIQKAWKSIGVVPHKYVDSIWKRFITACDYFFEQKKIHTSSQYDEEAKNLEAKKAVVERITKLDTSLETDEALSQLHALMDEWYAIGHVPYKLKDRVYRDFYEATEAQFDRLNIDKADRKLESFKTNLSDMAKSSNAKNQMLREREKLMRQYERMKGELQTYENNIGFLSVSSKKGNYLLDDMNQKMEKIKSELQLIVKKIGVIDTEL
ncbi:MULTISPECIES: DUF349 domain-containing protein [unclassified Proteiniphilum]|uniref:DUF349 domain-containing protein n=1 Tax=unclassified Proteiniphilum TaxID=2622718 RepID=UPI00257D9FAD|nr:MULTISPECIES: DUF349 domain-containing protein [unclassified Proteiniphilum]